MQALCLAILVVALARIHVSAESPFWTVIFVVLIIIPVTFIVLFAVPYLVPMYTLVAFSADCADRRLLRFMHETSDEVRISPLSTNSEENFSHNAIIQLKSKELFREYSHSSTTLSTRVSSRSTTSSTHGSYEPPDLSTDPHLSTSLKEPLLYEQQ